MKQHEATEAAYMNGYEKGKADAIREYGEVVRCRDCKSYNKISSKCGNCYKTTYIVHPDDYCSRGERKQENAIT